MAGSVVSSTMCQRSKKAHAVSASRIASLTPARDTRLRSKRKRNSEFTASEWLEFAYLGKSLHISRQKNCPGSTQTGYLTIPFSIPMNVFFCTVLNHQTPTNDWSVLLILAAENHLWFATSWWPSSYFRPETALKSTKADVFLVWFVANQDESAATLLHAATISSPSYLSHKQSGVPHEISRVPETLHESALAVESTPKPIWFHAIRDQELQYVNRIQKCQIATPAGIWYSRKAS